MVSLASSAEKASGIIIFSRIFPRIFLCELPQLRICHFLVCFFDHFLRNYFGVLYNTSSAYRDIFLAFKFFNISFHMRKLIRQRVRRLIPVKLSPFPFTTQNRHQRAHSVNNNRLRVPEFTRGPSFSLGFILPAIAGAADNHYITHVLTHVNLHITHYSGSSGRRCRACLQFVHIYTCFHTQYLFDTSLELQVPSAKLPFFL